ncbi:hypothetical protein CWI39_2532p0020 [Hamiltosporidium magnivora]|uniref:Uncharacterized protein n=1 Tax=Hamiltosporidium magnivora TaxID=148818 RepID=A0A4Q9KUH3_9MICR|nr:hypothetical protein CWI39_2532p0020 [Hamiltosporidium magnivora]
MNNKYESFYSFYIKSVVNTIKEKKFTDQLKYILENKIKIIIIDYCGLILKLYPYFVNIDMEYYYVYDVYKCKKELNELFSYGDIVFVFLDFTINKMCGNSDMCECGYCRKYSDNVLIFSNLNI